MARLLYFTTLADRLGRTAEELDLPASPGTAATLLDWLRARGPDRSKAFEPGAISVTVNRQFSGPDTAIDNRAEIGPIAARHQQHLSSG